MNVFEKFISCNFWQKTSLFVVVIFSFFLFWQNFIFSDSFAFLHLREVDDLAFQASLRQIHQSISGFQIDRLIKLNDYGYGWLFWIIAALFTYPFYLLAVATDFYAPLIIAPRDLSLFFTISTVFVVYKTLSVYSKNEFLKFVAIVFLLSLPAVSFFSMRFGTVAQVMFFSSLTFYLTIKRSFYERRDLKYISIAAAAAIGTKLNGALILPLIAVILADRFGWKINRPNLQKGGYFILNLVFFSILFINPSLFLSPFRSHYFFSFIDSIKNNSHLGLQNNFFQTLKDVVQIGYLNFWISLFLLGVGFYSRKKEIIFSIIWLTTSLLLLSKVMSFGTLYVINYMLVGMYLIPLLMIGFTRFKKGGEVLAVGVLALNFVLNYENITSGFYSSSKYFRMREDQQIVAKISASNKLKSLITNPKDFPQKQVNVLMDFRAVFPYANLERSNVNVAFFFDNIHLTEKQIKGDFDYVVFNKDSPFLLAEKEFSSHISGIKDEDRANNLMESRKIALRLLNNGRLGNATYNLLLDSNGIIFFAKNS